MEGRIKVRGEVFGTRLNQLTQVGDPDVAGRATGAGAVQHVEHADGTAEGSVISGDAAADPLPSVAGVVDHHQLIFAAAGVQRLELAVLATVNYNNNDDEHQNRSNRSARFSNSVWLLQTGPSRRCQ